MNLIAKGYLTVASKARIKWWITPALLLGAAVANAATQQRVVYTIVVNDEGNFMGRTSSFNFTGTGVTVTTVPGGAVINITGGGSSGLPLPADATNYIRNTTALQSGATFYVSSGNVTTLYQNSYQVLDVGITTQAKVGGLVIQGGQGAPTALNAQAVLTVSGREGQRGAIVQVRDAGGSQAYFELGFAGLTGNDDGQFSMSGSSVKNWKIRTKSANFTPNNAHYDFVFTTAGHFQMNNGGFFQTSQIRAHVGSTISFSGTDLLAIGSMTANNFTIASSTGAKIVLGTNTAQGGLPIIAQPGSTVLYSSASDTTGLAEGYWMDEAGNITLQTPHASDGPFDISADTYPMIWKDYNVYLGIKRWIHVSKMAELVQQMARTQGLIPSTASIVAYETFDPLDWDTVQTAIKARADAERSKIAAEEAGYQAELSAWLALPQEERDKVGAPINNVPAKPAIYEKKKEPKLIKDKKKK